MKPYKSFLVGNTIINVLTNLGFNFVCEALRTYTKLENFTLGNKAKMSAMPIKKRLVVLF